MQSRFFPPLKIWWETFVRKYRLQLMFGSCNNLPLISISQKPEICIQRDLKPIKNIWNMSNIHGIAFSINSNKQHHKTLRAKIDISAGLGCNASCIDNTTKVLDNDVILKTHFRITYQTRPILPYPRNERGFWIIRTYKTSRLIIYSTGTNNDREATTQGITEILKRNFMMQRTVNEDCMQREISWCRERSLQEHKQMRLKLFHHKRHTHLPHWSRDYLQHGGPDSVYIVGLQLKPESTKDLIELET